MGHLLMPIIKSGKDKNCLSAKNITVGHFLSNRYVIIKSSILVEDQEFVGGNVQSLGDVK